METDRELVERWRGGDERAFQDLVDRHKDLVYALIHRAVADQSRAEALAQEVFLRVYRGLPYFRGEASVATWIYRIVAHAFIEEAVRRPARVTNGAGEHGDAGRLPASRQAGDQGQSDVEWRRRLEQAIARLPAPARLLVAAHGLAGIPTDDLVEALQLAGTSQSQVQRAKRQLRRLLDTEP
jgi:RNA polymerase sigma-70 factor, ECF subfamily